MSSFHRVVAKAVEASKTSECNSIQETEEKFATLSLAFKTDQQTLDKRIELHLRARDVAENNIQKELQGVKDGLQALSQVCNSQTPARELLANVQHHVDVLEQSVSRMSSQAELHGAVQQELRISQAVDAMILHVENLKRTYQKEHAELEEARKCMLQSRQLSGDYADGENGGGGNQGAGRTLSKTNSRRRASIAVISKTPLLPSKTSSSQEENGSSSRVNRNSTLDSLLLSDHSSNASNNNNILFTRRSVKELRPLVRHCSSSLIESSSSLSPSSSSMSNSRPDDSDHDDGTDIAAEWAAFRRRQEARAAAELAGDQTREPPGQEVDASTKRKTIRLNSVPARLAKVVERLAEEDEEEDEDKDPEDVDLQAARRRLSRLMSRSHSIARQTDKRLIVWNWVTSTARQVFFYVSRLADEKSILLQRLAEMPWQRASKVVGVFLAAAALAFFARFCWSRFVSIIFFWRAN